MTENKEKLASWNEFRSFKLNWNELESYRNPETQMPIYSMINFYEAIGLVQAVKEWGIGNICSLDNIFCNANTQRKIHDFIVDNWEYYNLTLKGDCDIRWKEGQPKERRKFPHKPTARVKSSVGADYLNYCPGLDEGMEDDIISLGQMKQK